MAAIVTRLPIGEVYYFAVLGEDDWEVHWSFETGSSTDDRYFKFHNYFHTEEDAEQLANKLRAVLNGAKVIE